MTNNRKLTILQINDTHGYLERSSTVNLLGLDAWTVHWDFAYGPDRMRELAAKLNHPLLASNCYRIDTGELAYPPFTVIERGGVRVGVIGIAATIIDKTLPSHLAARVFVSRSATRNCQDISEA